MAKAETQAVVVQAFLAGGLVSMAANLPELYERSALYVDKILKGTKPADLPVEQPTKFQVAINMKTATRSRAIARCRRPGSASRASLQPADVTCAAAQAPPAPRIVRRQQYFPPHVSSLARVPWP
ncbi:MAG: ABC transporter substrate binding protein [Pseudolabrys sp.]